MTRWPRNITSVALIVIAVVALGVAIQIWSQQDSLKPLSKRTSSTPSPTPGTPTPLPTSTLTPAPASSANWQTTIVQQSSDPISPAPLLVAIRPGAHTADGYDRIAFDFQQAQAPGYRAEYVNQVVRDGSGQTVTLPGSHFLQLVFSPAVAHNESGNTAFSPDPVTLNYTALKSYVLNGDFEGQVSVALGLANRNGFRVSQQRKDANTWTVYIDVR